MVNLGELMPSQQAPVAARTGDITLTIEVMASQGKLAAGSYHDTLKLTVTPQT